MQQRQAAALAKDMAQGCLGVRVGRLHRLVGRHFDQALRPLGLSISQMEVLSALTLIAEPVTPSVLADALSIERSTMSRNLALMQAKGLIRATETSATGRSMAVTITDAGTGALAQAQHAWSEAQHAVQHSIGANAATVLDSWISGLAS